MNNLERYELSDDRSQTIASSKGKLFVHPKFGKVADFYEDDFQILGTYVDTLRQLYKGYVHPDVLTDCEHSISLGEKTFQLLSYDWLIGKSSKSSGYQYRLQNNELGIIIFFKMFHAKAESFSSHMKIECSPWFLDNKKPEEVDKFLGEIAKKILVSPEPHYPAIHLAVDVQGWQPDNELPERMTCRSKRISQLYGFDKAEFNLSEIACAYDRSQSFKFGSVNAAQLAIYNKTIQARSIDKFDYMEHKWKESTQQNNGCSGYDPDRDVYRFELRFHHSVIEQFALGSCDVKTGEIGVKMNTYSQVIRHIQALWQYGLKSFKLKYNTNYFEPIWTILQDDITFTYPEPSYQENLIYRRYYKRATSFSGKNYQLVIGNFLSACARKALDFETVLESLQSTVIWQDIAEHYESKDTPEYQLITKLQDSYQERLLLGFAV